MTLQHARIIKNAFPEASASSQPHAHAGAGAPQGRRALDPTRIGAVAPIPRAVGNPVYGTPAHGTPVADPQAASTARAPARAPGAEAEVVRARRIAAEVMAARAEAARIVAAARQEAHAVVTTAAAAAAAEAREKEIARLAAGFLALREADSQRAERDVARLIEVAVLLAERLVGESLRVEPTRIAELAAAALQEARGARRVRIDASPEDVAPLGDALGAIGQSADVQPDPTLPRGSLVVHTDLGRIDARLQPQLTRLAEALREALK
jgi:type III secretion protein L